MRFAGHLVAFIEIVDGVKDGFLIVDFADRAIGENALDAPLEHLPLEGAVEIVGHEEAAAQPVFAHFLCLDVVEAPFADLDGIEPGPIVGVAVVEVDGLFDGADLDAGQAAERLGEGAVGARVILGPQRGDFAPVAIEAAGIAVVGAGRIHEAGEGPFAGLVPVRGSFEFLVFDAGELGGGGRGRGEGGGGGGAPWSSIQRLPESHKYACFEDSTWELWARTCGLGSGGPGRLTGLRNRTLTG